MKLEEPTTLDEAPTKNQYFENTVDLAAYQKQQKEQEFAFKKYISEQYRQQLEYRQKKAAEQRYKELEQEKTSLAKAQELLALERQQKEEKLRQWRLDAKKTLTEREALRQHENLLKSLEKDEYSKMSQERTKKEHEREKEYKEFFKKYDDNLKARQEVHQNVVSTIERTKKQKFAEWEKEREADYLRKIKAKDEKEYYQKTQAKNEVIETLRKQLEEKEKEKGEFKKTYPTRAQENLKYTQELSQELQHAREKKLSMQQKYREFLEQQLKASSKYSTKGKGESFDIGRFEGTAPVAGLVPGINNISSVGSRPTCRIGKAIVSSASAMLSPLDSLNNTKHDMSGFKREKETPSHVTSLRYNTITNPIPLLTQNPYINKEINVAAHKLAKNIDI